MESKDPHRLAEARSLAFHRAVAAEIRVAPEKVAAARSRVLDWKQRGPLSPYHADLWLSWLAQPLEQLCDRIVAPDALAVELRQVTPFAGALNPRNRWELWAKTRREWERK